MENRPKSNYAILNTDDFYYSIDLRTYYSLCNLEGYCRLIEQNMEINYQENLLLLRISNYLNYNLKNMNIKPRLFYYITIENINIVICIYNYYIKIYFEHKNNNKTIFINSHIVWREIAAISTKIEISKITQYAIIEKGDGEIRDKNKNIIIFPSHYKPVINNLYIYQDGKNALIFLLSFRDSKGFPFVAELLDKIHYDYNLNENIIN